MIKHEASGFRLCYGGLELPFHIETRPRKNLSIAVHPDRTLTVVAPPGADVEKVLARVDGRAAWIARQWRNFAQAASPSSPRATTAEGEMAAEPGRYGYFPGETHWYLGRAYRLKMRPDEARSGRPSVELEDRFFWLVVPDREPERIAALLEAWYRARAKDVFALWLDNCLERSRSLGLDGAPPFEVRKMQKRWGSCTPGGKILLGLDLVKCPVDCIEYVLFHELCHLRHPHHGPEFYALLSRFLPDWTQRKARLEEWGRKI